MARLITVDSRKRRVARMPPIANVYCANGAGSTCEHWWIAGFALIPPRGSWSASRVGVARGRNNGVVVARRALFDEAIQIRPWNTSPRSQ